MTWAQRLKRFFKIDIETCRHCGGAVKVIASTVTFILSQSAFLAKACYTQILLC